MSENNLRKRTETMPISLKIDKSTRESSYGTSVSRESSFSSVELGASNSVSRESSFSSVASSNGSGGFFEVDSSRSSSRSNSWRSSEDSSESRQRISSVTDQQYQRLHNARERFRKAREPTSNDSSVTEESHAPPENTRSMTNLKRPEVHGRSASEPHILVLSPISSQSKLSASPDGLVISTPPVKSFIEYRLRSRSFTGSEHSEEERGEMKNLRASFSHSHLQVPDSRNDCMRRSGRKSCGENQDQNAEKVTVSEEDYQTLKKEMESLRQERDCLRRECDRLRCERDAVQLERDTLLCEKSNLQVELNNRNDIIQHLQDHVTKPVNSLVVPDEVKSTPKKQRSKSEVRRPAFYFPEEMAKTNAYTCL